MIRFGHLGQWVTISGPRHAVMGSTVKAAVWRYRFVRREAWIIERGAVGLNARRSREGGFNSRSLTEVR